MQSIRLLNITAPLSPYGDPLLGELAPGSVGDVSQADAQQSLILSYILAERSRTQMLSMLLNLNGGSQYSMHRGQPPIFDQISTVSSNNTTDSGIAISAIFTHPERQLLVWLTMLLLLKLVPI